MAYSNRRDEIDRTELLFSTLIVFNEVEFSDNIFAFFGADNMMK